MTRYSIAAAFLSMTLLGGTAYAEKRVEHFKGKPSETLQQAVANFSSENERLKVLLSKKELTPQDLIAIHELTYTLEVALAKINTGMLALSNSLEGLHQASERLEEAGARTHGDSYLKTVQTIFP